VAAQLGYCGLDPRRQPLTGEEIRGCWEGWPVGASQDPTPPLTIAPAQAIDEPHRPLAFVEVGSAADPNVGEDGPAPSLPGARSAPTEPGWNLWGDPDR
jgi:hypothetical protein